MQFSIANSDAVDSFGGATIGKYGAWNVCHDRTMIEISQGNGDPRIIWYGHGLGRHERSAIVPKLVAAIEGVIDATEGG